MRLCGLFLILSLLSSMAFGDSPKDNIFVLLTTLPKVSTAKIKRGNKEIPIDLAAPTAASQIQDYDVILLENGVYSTLGNFTAKYVRVRGQGPRKTFITSMIKNSKPILVNSTEFWDLSIADAKFKVSDLNGLWAVNVEFAGSILVRPPALDKSPAFTIRTVFSDLTLSDLPMNNEGLYSHFLTKHGDNFLMPLPGDFKDLKEKRTAKNLLAYEDLFDQTRDIALKNRIGFKGLFARGLNYLYQKDVLTPQYDAAKFDKLAKNARSTKAQGHLYVSMLYWAEADRLSGHSRFDEVLKEITPLSQIVSKECGCTVEGQGLASTIRSEIEQSLYTKLPIMGVPGRCKIQTLFVVIPDGGKKVELITAARLKNNIDQTVAFQDSEYKFERSVIAHSGKPVDEEFLMGAEAPVEVKDYTAVADLEMAGIKKSYTSDVVAGKDSIDENIIDPIAKIFKEKFAPKIIAAKAKIASSVLVAKLDGFITQALYGDTPGQDRAYEELMEQQLGRKVSAQGAMGAVFAY